MPPRTVTHTCYPVSAGGRAAGRRAACPPGAGHSVVLSADDHSRVRLTPLDGEPHSDYINANFIPVRASCGAVCGGVCLGDGPLCRTRCPTLALALVLEDHQLVFL